MKQGQQAMLIRYPRTVIANKENYYREYNGHIKLISCQFPKNIHFFMHMLIIYILYVQSIRKLQ